MLDSANILVQAGKGGDGFASFRREKYVPFGGPWGGDGGEGGSIFFVATKELNNLVNFHRKKIYQAQNGETGKTKNMKGKNGEDLIIPVPVGTLVYEKKGNKQILTHDFINEKDIKLIVQGGKGGLGNTHFKSSTNQTPKEFTLGTQGDVRNLILDLKLIADIGIIGFPNSGKSTLLKILTKANPKIANYPFTTLDPNLGTLNIKNKTFVLADIPGLIEGASKGKGLGDKFLKHIQRTKILIHLVDVNNVDLELAYKTITRELIDFDKSLKKKKEIIVISKYDTEEISLSPESLKFIQKYDCLLISSLTHKNIDELIKKIYNLIT
ncbi:GTPase ObgE [Candidatus Berkelbacteria bacterium CG_4_8_14_3_um_filter_33_6]|uniref:GTPase Obg n=1 Tax=Candidatus Berkelbacteria bacterium CG_4_10_14_0_2_um_filter_35_9_33_12 TaxID=1974499 RepID=A0A2M7W4K2_9BACT|nr:MAG: GTPase ObgE [Candidatus Berkelbacteria bacterium CG23_combo_of_CG06-09_8_20_14_all_33_15]PIS08137.1 MAG: GTPase ObgE [Candidatus Berkelbacteria bacterium CG10_big_fil_rev_8_21_14_0_10_33_10]PIX30933.1 MAG: GTPase ObgE [Candidatus Berkelbacteria bacterium CG_4_8_14_3_um_filter_33_6]PIZ27948.1 MAG: GTPase ObgE [Candidatus Berkelbacteria bacterium CG_4_10_14_0_8_um_filter_35_9_33_8]PJA20746.1 MAG: GTPase ObgE [Candidatus Berkelbacteria bacterium CG_4_10_14_0_2_um_filter_35_9_33_12]PJB5205